MNGVSSDLLAYLLQGMGRTDQLAPLGCVDPVETWETPDRCGDAQMDLPSAGPANHLNDLTHRGPPNDRVIDNHNTLIRQDRLDRIVLYLRSKIADPLCRFDKRPADVMITDNSHVEWEAGLLGESQGRTGTGVGDGNDHIARGGALSGQNPARGFSGRGKFPPGKTTLQAGERKQFKKTISGPFPVR